MGKQLHQIHIVRGNCPTQNVSGLARLHNVCDEKEIQSCD